MPPVQQESLAYAFKVQSDRGLKPSSLRGNYWHALIPLTLCQHHLHISSHAAEHTVWRLSNFPSPQRLKKSLCFESVTEGQPGIYAASSHAFKVSLLQHSNLSPRSQFCEALTSSGPRACEHQTLAFQLGHSEHWCTTAFAS